MSVERDGPCATCFRVRWFLTVAGFLIVGLYMQPEWATGVARLMPSPLVIGLGICSVAGMVFARRVCDHQRQARHGPRRHLSRRTERTGRYACQASAATQQQTQ